ncbi:hypothetical protein A2U01_0083006, partial [Trifolium medium]|nr:hypothetical protein [Trifolium medium]
MVNATSVVREVIFHMISHLRMTSVLIVGSYGTRPRFVVRRRYFVSIVARKVTRVQRAGGRGWPDEEFVLRVIP